MTKRVAILNLMPIKETTEEDFKRVLLSSSIKVEIVWMSLSTHVSKHADPEHMRKFYRDFNSLRDEHFDGFIMTGVPVEMIDFEEVTYWPELCDIMEWTKTHVHRSLYVCWGSQAGLYYFYGINKHIIPVKKFGIFTIDVERHDSPLMEGFGDKMRIPHSRHTSIDSDKVRAEGTLKVLAGNEECGTCIIETPDGRMCFDTGHLEYAPGNLDFEYHRDLGKRDDVSMPVNYYIDDDEAKGIDFSWEDDGLRFYHNWIKTL